MVNYLELFSGFASVGQEFKNNGHNVFTIDNNKSFNPDLVKDIMEITIDDIPFYPDIIWASPPCQCFSVASISTHWDGGKLAYVPKTEACRNSLQLIEKTLSLILELSPKYWFIENPRGVLRKVGVMKYLPKKTVTYCQYGDTRMKPTDIWTNCDILTPRPMCHNGDSCHESAPRGSKTGTQGISNRADRARIPEELCKEIYEVCMNGSYK